MKKIINLILATFLSSHLMTGAVLANTPALNFEAVEIEESVKLLADGDASSPEASFELSMNYPKRFKNKRSLKGLQQLITAKVLGDDYADSASLDAAISRYLVDYERNYRNNLRETFGDDLTEQLNDYPMALSYVNKINHTIEYQTDRILSFTVDHWLHQGGTHGVGIQKHYSINLNELEVLSLSQLMKPGYEAELTKIVKQHLLQIKADKFKAYQTAQSQPDERTLRESFFNYDEITLPDNFMLTDMGLAFTYNPYDIDTFAAGSYELDIAYSEVAHLLNKKALRGLIPEINLQAGSDHFALNDVSYDGYLNERYQFMLQYPDFLIAQGESDSGDGQRFISRDGAYMMRVYHDFKALSGENPSLEEAYYAESGRLSNIAYEKLNDNYYWFQGKAKRTRYYQQFTFLIQDQYFTLYIEYPAAAEAALKPIIQHVAASFSVLDAEIGTGALDEDLSIEFVSFLHDFLETTFWENNLNALLRDNHKLLKPYLDPKHDVRRYHSPGAVPHLYTRADNFGFDNMTDFTTTVELPGESSYAELTPDMSVCELDFERSGSTTIYYGPSAWEFTALVNPETFEFAPIPSPYPDAAVMQVFVPMYYQGFVNPRGLYFIQSPRGWKLMFVDDSLCGA